MNKARPMKNRQKDVKPDHGAPKPEELARRVENLRRRMELQGLDHYLVFSPDNVFYLTNFANYIHERPFVLIVDKKGKVKFIVPTLEVPHVTMRAIGDVETVSYQEFPAPPGKRWNDRLAEILPQGSKVGIETTCPHFISAAIDGSVTAIDLVDDMRMVKSGYELARIQYACDLATKAHNHFLASARVGQTMLEAYKAATGEIMMALLTDEPSLNLLATKIAMVFQPPKVSHDPHNFTDINMALGKGGPHVSIINGVMNGYGAEVERTFFLGDVPEAAKRPFETMLKARQAVLKVARPGILMSDVDKAANDVFRCAGYGDNLLHRAGHGIGVTGHEGPFFAEGYDREIEPGMVFTVEPGVYLPGVGGFRHSDTIRIDDTGPVLMTEGPTELDQLILDV